MNYGDSLTVYLAFAIGDSLDGLQNSIQEAVQKHQMITDISTKQKGQLPKSYALYQNYPNPFNPNTTIEFDLPKTAEVTLKIFNILGEEVATLVSDRLSAGSYSYEWTRTGGIASGVYLYRLQAGDYVETRKMVLLR